MADKEKGPADLRRDQSQRTIEEFEIRIKERLHDQRKSWFEGMTLHYVTNGEAGQACTIITGPVIDQPALHGLLERIRDLNLTLISVIKVYPEDHDDRERKQVHRK